MWWTICWLPAHAMEWRSSAPICKSWSAATANSATALTRARRIRANQGHTVEVDLQLEPLPPPELLYQGTAERSVEATVAGGLLRMTCHHVHFSADVETAWQVGCDMGGRMCREGYPFYHSDNGVWLVDRVPLAYIAVPAARVG